MAHEQDFPKQSQRDNILDWSQDIAKALLGTKQVEQDWDT